ncbi:MAG: hypothetical protein HXY50_08290 [Ignavibacteriaceae bacterium]|nr:hypothetical protein [Ignavibacteriaceae bacterium]
MGDIKELFYCIYFLLKPSLLIRFSNFRFIRFNNLPASNIILLTILFLILSNESFGQSKAGTAEHEIGGTFYMGVPYSIFNDDSKNGQGIDDGLGLLSFGFDVVFNNIFLLGSEFGWDSPKDEKQFSNLTTAGELSSSVSLWHYSFSGGLKIPDIYFSDEKAAFTFASFSFGHMWAFLEKRSIENCIDCDREDVDIDGGLFIQPELYYVYGILGFGLSYKHFFYSDYKTKAEFKLALVIR